MKTEKQLRVSQFKDYVAVDLVNEKGEIQSTPIYLKKNVPVKMLAWDAEEYKYVPTNVTFDGDKLLCSGDMDWESPLDELVDVSKPGGIAIFKMPNQ